MGVTATPEGGYKTLSETTVHETVSNWITAGGRVGQQLDVRLGHAGQIAPGTWNVKNFPGDDSEEWSPAYEEFQYDNKQHFNDTLFVLQ